MVPRPGTRTLPPISVSGRRGRSRGSEQLSTYGLRLLASTGQHRGGRITRLSISVQSFNLWLKPLNYDGPVFSKATGNTASGREQHRPCWSAVEGIRKSVHHYVAAPERASARHGLVCPKTKYHRLKLSGCWIGPQKEPRSLCDYDASCPEVSEERPSKRSREVTHPSPGIS